MIYTRMGSEVKILGGDMKSNRVKIRFMDGEEIETYIYELKADQGIIEISQEILNANSRTEEE